MIKYIFFYFLFFVNKLYASFELEDIDPIDGVDLNTIASDYGYGYDLLIAILTYFRDSIFSLLIVLGIGAFIYIGIKLIIARGKPDEFKKAFTNLIYVIVGILIVSLSWALVKFASGIEFF